MSAPEASREYARHLAELVDFRPDQGIIRLHEQRVVLLSSAAFGLLRKEMIDSLGLDTARRLLLRFGYVNGYHDALSLRDQLKWSGVEQGLTAGVVLQRLAGVARTEVARLEHDVASGHFRQDLVWHDSYVAEQHLHHCGKSTGPVCWSLVGYASGYASACLENEVYFREDACLGQGAPTCTVIGKDVASWGDDAATLRADFQGSDLAVEVERQRRVLHSRLQVKHRLSAKRNREQVQLRQRVGRLAAAKQFVAGTTGMKQVLETAARVAPLETTVLIVGRSGTGKEFIVRLIHDESTRAAGPFVSINCAALTDTLLESELFGHVRGAFTGAVRDKAGLFEVASNGTLFLDEVGEAAPGVQAKLLRALQEREIRRVGGERTIKVNARVIAATNRDLQAAIAAGTFREDLYFRLAGFIITIPPLGDRREDIPLLVHNFVRRAARRVNKNVQAVSADALNVLMRYRWPGNVRELEHAIERAVIVARGEIILPRDLPPDLVLHAPSGPIDDSLDLRQQERSTIVRALERCGGNRRAAAGALHISTVTLWRKLKQHGLVSGSTHGCDTLTASTQVT